MAAAGYGRSVDGQGSELGLQTGLDSEGLVTAPPPPALEPSPNAESWRHLYRAACSISTSSTTLTPMISPSLVR